MKKEPRVWKLVAHNQQIADTGDYDGCYEITDGRISIFSKDDDDEALQEVVEALNGSDCSFYQDDWIEMENRMLKDDIRHLRERIAELEMKTNSVFLNSKKL